MKVAQKLLELSADINLCEDQGGTPLHAWQWNPESEDVALLLLECGADPGVWDDHGQTPLA